MPELPEVETIRRDLDSALKGAVIKDVVVDKPGLVRESGVRGEIGGILVGSVFKEVRRRAKLLTFVLEKGGQELYLVAHLKMTGRFLLRRVGAPKDQYQHVTFTIVRPPIKGGPTQIFELRFCDLRQFGYLQIVSKEELGKILAAYGPEPLDDLTLAEFKKRLQRKIPIKVLLLDQKVFSGIGNIYANEALFEACVHPQKEAALLSETEAKKLFESISGVLRSGLKNRGTTTRDESFRDIYNEPGDNAKNLKVYEKQGLDCPRGRGGKIKKIMIGGRGSYFCPDCQLEYPRNKT